MQEELEMMRPQLEEAAKDTVVTMEKIKVNKMIKKKLKMYECKHEGIKLNLEFCCLGNVFA